MSGLRERRHAETKRAIVDAAFVLFERHGFAETIMEHIAEHAGVSRSTLYRRYRSKEDIVLDVPKGWLAAWDAAIDDLSPDAGLATAIETGCLAVALQIDGSPERVLAAYRALSESPALQASSTVSRDWLERVVEVVRARAPDLSRFDAMAIAGAYLGAIDTMMLVWSDSGGTTSVSEATHKVLDRLAPILR